jgi:hypothetical protein
VAKVQMVDDTRSTLLVQCSLLAQVQKNNRRSVVPSPRAKDQQKPALAWIPRIVNWVDLLQVICLSEYMVATAISCELE